MPAVTVTALDRGSLSAALHHSTSTKEVWGRGNDSVQENSDDASRPLSTSHTFTWASPYTTAICRPPDRNPITRARTFGPLTCLISLSTEHSPSTANAPSMGAVVESTAALKAARTNDLVGHMGELPPARYRGERVRSRC